VTFALFDAVSKRMSRRAGNVAILEKEEVYLNIFDTKMIHFKIFVGRRYAGLKSAHGWSESCYNFVRYHFQDSFHATFLNFI
jgi:hypothetical protein